MSKIPNFVLKDFFAVCNILADKSLANMSAYLISQDAFFGEQTKIIDIYSGFRLFFCSHIMMKTVPFGKFVPH